MRDLLVITSTRGRPERVARLASSIHRTATARGRRLPREASVTGFVVVGLLAVAAILKTLSDKQEQK